MKAFKLLTSLILFLTLVGCGQPNNVREGATLSASSDYYISNGLCYSSNGNEVSFPLLAVCRTVVRAVLEVVGDLKR